MKMFSCMVLLLGLGMPVWAASGPSGGTVPTQPASPAPGLARVAATNQACVAAAGLPPGEEPNVAAATQALSERLNALALAHLIPLADTNREAARMYGRLLLVGGTCVTTDKAKGVSYLKRAGDGGDVQAQVMLGQFYQQGAVLPQNDAESVHWYQKAAETGDPVAATNLGYMYRSGRGTAANPHLALQWTARGAAAGRSAALAAIAAMYFRGEGLPKDAPAAYFWACAADDRTADDAPSVHQYVTHLKEDIARGLSIDAAQKIAQKAKRWVPGPHAMDKVLKQEVKS